MGTSSLSFNTFLYVVGSFPVLSVLFRRTRICSFLHKCVLISCRPTALLDAVFVFKNLKHAHQFIFSDKLLKNNWQILRIFIEIILEL